MRGQTLHYRQQEFVQAARVVGAKDKRIMGRHLLPNIIGPCIVAETLAIPTYIYTEAFLSFIGLGIALLLIPLSNTTPWGALAAIVINAYIGTGLAMALLVFYRSRVVLKEQKT